MSYIPRLKKDYKEKATKVIMESNSLSNIMQVPKLKKIVISKGVGAAVADKKLIDHAVEELTSISGQKAIATKSKKDVASFKLRKGMPIGAKVTLRGNIMYEFLDRLITAALPRVREFQGVKNSGFDGRGNYTLGITEQIIFPEINIDKINNISGMDITFVTSSNDDNLAKSLLKELGLPFKQNDKAEKLREIELEKLKELKKKEVDEQAKSEVVADDNINDSQVVNKEDSNQSSIEGLDKKES